MIVNHYFFEHYINKNNLKYNECILIDDSKELTNLCKQIGMNNIQIDNCVNIINELRKCI